MDRDERIRQRAYEIWESEGRPQGQQGDHWRRAEQEIEDEEKRQPHGTETEPAGPMVRSRPVRQKAGGMAASGGTATGQEPGIDAATEVRADGSESGAPAKRARGGGTRQRRDAGSGTGG